MGQSRREAGGRNFKGTEDTFEHDEYIHHLDWGDSHGG